MKSHKAMIWDNKQFVGPQLGMLHQTQHQNRVIAKGIHLLRILEGEHARLKDSKRWEWWRVFCALKGLQDHAKDYSNEDDDLTEGNGMIIA